MEKKGWDINWDNVFGVVATSLAVTALSIFFYIIVIAEHKHQGYYLSINRAGEIPTYRVMNNWRWEQDDTAFVSIDPDEAIAKYNELSAK